MRRKHHFRPPSSSLQQHHEAIESSGREGRNSSSSSITTTKHTINDTLCPPTNTYTLQQLVQKHITTLPKYISSKPIAKHNIEAFNEVLNFISCYNLKQQQPSSSSTSCTSSSSSSKTKVILDSGCGTGRSSYILAQQNKDCIIIGIDQSLVRLCRNKAYYHHYHHHRDNSNNDNKKDKEKVMTEEEEKHSSSNSNNSSNNVLLVRAELSDFWYLCLSSTIFNQIAYIDQHYLLYPNPYPKKSRLQNRFYAHPSFPLLMMTLDNNNNGIMVGNNNNDDNTVDKVVLIVRSNWKGYLDEFKMATNVWRKNTMIGTTTTTTNNNDVVINNDNDWALQDKTAIIAWKTSGPDQLNPCNIISPMTNFEAKFLECDEPIYEFTIIIRKKKIGYK